MKVRKFLQKTTDAVMLASLNVGASASLMGASSMPSFAQFAGATTVMLAIQAAFIAVGLSIIIIGCWIAGYRIMKKGATWDDISNVVLGSLFMGGSVGIGGWLWGLSKA